jgi:nucleoside phosphorylase/CheY-like chemotaxis protein
VEDNAEKLQKITQVILSVESLNLDDITAVTDARNAQLKLLQHWYDLLILDIAIPSRIDEDVERDGGVKLLEEIMTRERFKLPDHIIGITAYPDILREVSQRFSRRLLTITYYDPSSDDWEQSLRSRALHLVQSHKTKQDRGNDGYHSYLSIICALDSPELEAVRRLPWNWNQAHVAGDPTIYFGGQLYKNGEQKLVYTASAPRMGMTAAATLSMKMISAFRPQYLAIAGITAAMPGKANYGDIVVADPAFDWGSGKWSVQNGELVFSADPHQLHLTPELRRQFNLMASEKSIFSQIREKWPADKPNHDLQMLIGPLASGASVLADGSWVQMIKQHQRKLVGIDMETYGVFAAAEESSAPRPQYFCMKSVVDFADENKNDLFQRYAAFSSAECLKRFVEDFL